MYSNPFRRELRLTLGVSHVKHPRMRTQELFSLCAVKLFVCMSLFDLTDFRFSSLSFVCRTKCMRLARQERNIYISETRNPFESVNGTECPGVRHKSLSTALKAFVCLEKHVV